jgi:demethylmenaquinone methyltransferase/2-methoxy-6-polyprenyl-1,4-benzoquinol methylase
MFSRIASQYDLMNRLITVGQDRRWRKEIIRRVSLPLNGCLLDLGTGTGSLAQEAFYQYPTCHIIAADFTLEMMYLGKSRYRKISSINHGVNWCAADAHCLPFPDNTFDAIVSSFLLRNVCDIRQSLADQFRILKIGGKFVALDTTPPTHYLFSPFTLFYLHVIVPFMGKIITDHAEDYKYLAISTENFFYPKELIAYLIEAGFQDVNYRLMMFGSIAIYWGCKPPVEGNR